MKNSSENVRSVKLREAQAVIAEKLEEIRREVFVPEERERYKLTFIARSDRGPTYDILVTEDDPGPLVDFAQRAFSHPVVEISNDEGPGVRRLPPDNPMGPFDV